MVEAKIGWSVERSGEEKKKESRLRSREEIFIGSRLAGNCTCIGEGSFRKFALAGGRCRAFLNGKSVLPSCPSSQGSVAGMWPHGKIGPGLNLSAYAHRDGTHHKALKADAMIFCSMAWPR